MLVSLAARCCRLLSSVPGSPGKEGVKWTLAGQAIPAGPPALSIDIVRRLRSEPQIGGQKMSIAGTPCIRDALHRAEELSDDVLELQTAKYSEGVPNNLPTPRRPLPFQYQSTGVETRFTNLLEPDARSRRAFSFHRPDTLDQRLTQELQHRDASTRTLEPV